MPKKYNYTKKTGRPIKYRDWMCDTLDDYLATTGREQMSLPTIEGFACYLDVSRVTLYDWAKKHKKLSYTLEKILRIQGKQLIDDGIYGGKEVNATIVKLLLQNNHGMREKTDTDITSGGKPIPIMGGTSNVHKDNSVSENSNSGKKD